MYSINYNKLNSRLDNSHFKILYFSGGKGIVSLNNHKIEVKKGMYIRVNKNISIKIEKEIQFYIIYMFPEYLYSHIKFLKSTSFDSIGDIQKIEEELYFLDYSVSYLKLKQIYYLDIYFELIKEWDKKSSLIIMLFFNFSFTLSLEKNHLINKREDIIKIIYDIRRSERSSSSKLLRKEFKKEVGNNCKEYLLEEKIMKGLMLIETTDYKIEEISKLCDIKSPSYFIKLIKEKTGITPKKYRKAFKEKIFI